MSIWNEFTDGTTALEFRSWIMMSTSTADNPIYDAGMADIIAESFLKDKALQDTDSELRLRLTPDAVQNLRSEILGLITERAQAAQNVSK